MRNKKLTILLIGTLFFVFWQWWLPGSRVANDFSIVSRHSLKSFMSLPQTWSVKGTEGLGEYTVFTLWSWPLNFLQGLLANLNVSFDWMERSLFVTLFLIIGGVGVWKLCKTLGLSSSAKIISTLFYLTNTYIILVIDGGQLSISLSYALFPWSFMVFERSLENGLKRKVLAGLLIFGIGIFDIRFIYIFFLLCLTRFLYEFLFISKSKWSEWIFSWIKTGFVVTSIVLGLNAYWILVLIKYPISPNFYQYLTQTSFVSFVSLSHSILLLSPHWYKNIFGYITPLRFEFFLIPIFVYLAPILQRKDKNVGFWFLVAVLSVFLTKGTSEPLGFIYKWFYYNIPGFSLFRDSSKFFFLVALSYTVLIGITVDQIQKRISKQRLRFLVVVVIGAYFVLLSRPVWLNQMTGTFSQPILQKEYNRLNKFIKDDKKESNVFWIPTISPMTELDFYHPAVEAFRLVQKRPFAQATIGTYELFNFLREAPYMGQLFNVANIGYVVYPPLDLRRSDPHPDNIRYYQTFLSQLSKLPWLSKVENSQIPLFKVKEHQDKFFLTPNIWWVIGSDDIYNESTKSAKLALSKNALIFVEEFGDLEEKINEIPTSKIILNNKTLVDLAAIKIPSKDLIFPAQILNHDPNFSGWWKRDTVDLLAWKDFLKTKYGIINQDFDFEGGWAVGEGNRKLKIENGKWKIGDVLLARVLESTRSGELKFYQNDKLIGQVNTKNKGDNFKWVEVGILADNKTITITSEGEVNVVNVLASLPVSVWQDYKNNAKKLNSRIVSFKPENVDEESALVTYKQINPTKYSINIQNLKKPSILIFSQNFNKNWKLNGQSPILVYSFLNGFSIDKDGSYELSFEPQKFILLTLGVSIVVFIVCIVFLVL